MHESSLERGIELFNNGEFYECHEVLEDVWRAETGARKLFLQAIIHFAVALYHEDRRNPSGATGQLRKGIAKLAPYVPEFDGIDTSRLFNDGLLCLSLMEQGRRVATPIIRRCSV